MKLILLTIPLALAFFLVPTSEAQTTVPLPNPQTSDKFVPRNKYKHPKLKFSLEYPKTLSTWDFPDGVGLDSITYDCPNWVRILVSKTSITYDQNTARKIARNYWRFRSAKPGQTVDWNYIKVENLDVNGFPAVKVIYETKPRKERASPDETSKQPYIYNVIVYIRKGKEIWEVRSITISKQHQEKVTGVFEEVLKTLRFPKFAK
jgi:hypothetical protein